jgi:hypothetical protein
MRSAHIAKALLLVLCIGWSTACGLRERSDILILVRADDPTSIAIGEYYASARNVPSGRILQLTISDSDQPTEIEPAQYASEIAGPIESYLTLEDPDGEISILITTAGIPLRIGDCKKNRAHYPRDCRLAAVDAALAGLGRFAPAEGLRAENVNPYFGDRHSFDRFRRDRPDSKLRFLVARITGPRQPVEAESKLPSAIRQLIDLPETIDAGASPVWRVIADAPRSSRADASAALFDPITERLEPTGHRVCDPCSDATQARAAAGIVVQSNPASTSVDAARTRLADPGWVIALGGSTDCPKAAEGAGKTHPKCDDPFQQSMAMWLARGARAISTHIEDPSLSGVTRPAIQLQTWISGRTAIEAHFASVPHLGWVNVFVGDPLLVINESFPVDPDDQDNDGVTSDQDNCLDVTNPEQRDTDGDEIGNRCDPDVDNDGRVDTSWGQIYPLDSRGDLEAIALTARNGPYDPDHDINGDGEVNASDLALAQFWLFRSPGPSGR